LVAAERLAAALAKPAPRAPLSAPEPTLAPWRPHAVDEAAVEGAAASMGGSIDDLEAAIRDGSVSWETRIRERPVLDAIKALRPMRCSAAPPRFSAPGV